MRVLIISSYYYPNMLGGTEHSIKLLAEGLVKNGHEVFVISADKKDKESEEINGVKVFRIDLKFRSKLIVWKLIRKGFEFRNYMIRNKLKSLIHEISPDVIHTNSLFYLSPIVWDIAKKEDIKVVHTLRDYWGICPKCTLLNHKNEICYKKGVLCKIHQLNYQRSAKNIDIVTAPSNFTLNEYKKHGVYNDTTSIMISNAIDINMDEHRKIINERNNRKSDLVKFLFIGSLTKFKGIEYLIETFKGIEEDNIRLIICGEGPLKDFILQEIKNDSRIEFMGKVEKKEKENILLESDVMIVPSIWYEPFGRVVIEGYKYGLPVIGTNIGGISELVNTSVGIKITPGSHKELNDAIKKVNNRKKVKEYLQNFEKEISAYDLNEQILKFEQIYKL